MNETDLSDLLGDHPSNLPIALDLADRGFRIFPITRKRHGKWTPIFNWQEAATTDIDTVQNWFREFPDARIGLPTGRSNGLIVLDLDRKNGKDGFAALAGIGLCADALSAQGVRTPSGGEHRFFAYREGVRNSVSRLGPGLDIRSEGGFVVAPGSFKRHARYEPFGPPLSVESLPTFPDELCLPEEPNRSEYDLSDLLAEAPPVDWSEVKRALQAIDPDCDRDTWIRVGMALHSAGLGSEDVFATWDQWSAGGEKYNRSIMRSQWTSFDRQKGEKIGIATLFYIANRNGWSRFEIDLDDFDDLDPTDKSPAPADREWTFDAFDPSGEPDLSHDQLALDLGSAGWDRNARFVPDLGGWMLWNRTHWRVSKDMRHMTIIRSFLRAKANSLIEWSKAQGDDRSVERAKRAGTSLRSTPFVAAVETQARSNDAARAVPQQFDRHLHLLGTPTGTVDLTTGDVRLPNAADYITRLTAVPAGAAGTSPAVWLQFLDRIFGGDEALVELAQRLAGYSLTGETREHKLFVFYGTGRNGKSTFLQALQGLAGDYAVGVASSVFLDARGEQHPTGIAGLRGARLAIGSELPPGKQWNEETIKSLTGGDVMSARLMRQDFFDFSPQCTLIIPGNRKPSFKGVDEALRARVVLVPFTVTIPEAERDPKLGEKLKTEWPMILRWAIEGAVKWYQSGLQIPDAVRAASREYMDSEDHLGQFIEDETIADPMSKVSSADAYSRFRIWQQDQGTHHGWSQRAMTTALRERGWEYFVGNGFRGFKGVRLRDSFGDLK